METYIPNTLFNVLIASLIFSTILMSLIQKFKSACLVKKDWHICLLNLIFSFGMGIPFGMYFYDINFYNSIWIGLFSFIGAPTIYEALKNQNFINYTPSSLNDESD